MQFAVLGGELLIGDRGGQVKARRDRDGAAHESLHLAYGRCLVGRRGEHSNDQPRLVMTTHSSVR